MKIYAPVKDTNGVYASVRFVNGVGETNNLGLIEWFRKNGYRVEKSEKQEAPVEKPELTTEYRSEATEKLIESLDPNFEAMTPNELRDWMRENGYGSKIKNTRNKEKLLEILRG